MKRRTFIKFSIVTGIVFSSEISIAKTFEKEKLLLLNDIFQILFPKTKNMPSSLDFGATEYLIKNVNHKTFDDYDKNLIFQGSEDFLITFPNFLILSLKEKSEIIHSIVNTNDYAQTWLSKLVYYGIEAMLSHPIYAGNKNKISWSAINHNIGIPEPQIMYVR